MRSPAQKDRPVAGLMKLISKRMARVGVIGLGYVGLPLAVRLADAGFTVSGFDINEDRRQMIDSGISYLADVPSEEINAVTSAGGRDAGRVIKL